MKTQSIQTVESRVTKDDDQAQNRLRQLAERQQDLASYGRNGYSLTHTYVIEGVEYVTFVDTLTRDNDDES